MINKILTHLGVFAATVALLWAALVLTSLIPNESIKANMTESAMGYADPAPFSFENGGKYNSVADNYADVILQNILWHISSDDPFVSSLDTKYYSGEEVGLNWGYYSSVKLGKQPDTDYTRYWHGSVIFIRPLMLVTTVHGIKTVGLIAVVLLALAVIALLVAKKQYFAAAAFAFSLLSVQFYNVRLSLEYIPMFLVSLTFCILFICLEKKGDNALTILSVISGASAAFFDFLTAETLSVLLPLMLVFIIREQDGRNGKKRESILIIIKCFVCWGCSYVMTFLVKWTAASVVTGENKFSSAIASAGERVGGEAEKLPFVKQLFLAPLANISTMFGGETRVDVMRIIVVLLAALFLFGGVFLIGRRYALNRDFALICLIIGAVPYIRYMILSNHSYLHEFFTYRAQASTVLALLAAIWFNMSFSEPKKKYAGKKKKRKA